MSISLSEAGAERTIMAAGFSHTGLIREERGEREGGRGSEVLSQAKNEQNTKPTVMGECHIKQPTIWIAFSKAVPKWMVIPSPPCKGAVHPCASSKLWAALT